MPAMNSRYGLQRLVLKMQVWLLDTSISGKRVVRELGDLIAQRGAASMVVSGDGRPNRPRTRC